MKPPTCTCKDSFHTEEELFVSKETDCITKILDNKYKPTDLKELTENLPRLNNNQRKQIHTLLDKQCSLFDGTLDLWKDLLHKIGL